LVCIASEILKYEPHLDGNASYFEGGHNTSSFPSQFICISATKLLE
jgi:hypothetical protein